ncbi:polyphosphate kinase 2 family protein [Aurantivibrio plasticivorans]
MTKAPSPIDIETQPPKLSDIDLSACCTEAEYESGLKLLQWEMLRIQQAYFHQQLRALIVFEGWDAAGKGGAIRRLTEKLDPRSISVYPIGAPSAEEQSRHYLYRFFNKLPAAGSLAVFDRSYYGRVLVERVEGYASDPEWQRAYQEINEFERLLINDGVRIVKLFLHIDADEQLKRFEQRLQDPVKRWKLTADDIRNRQQWSEYEIAINDMFRNTSTRLAPWCVIPANKKWFARLSVMQTVVDTLSKGVDLTPPPLDKDLIIAAEKQLGISFSDKK